MENRQFKSGDIVRHFKGNKYQVIEIAEHVDGGKLVVYKSLSEPSKVWARNYDEFMSKVDADKYPEVTQYYRFELECKGEGGLMEYKDLKKIQFLHDTIVCRQTNKKHELYYHVEIHDGIEECFEHSFGNIEIPEEIREFGDNYTLKVGISLDNNEFILNIASIVITSSNIVSEEVIQIVKSINAYDEDIELYLKIIALINGEEIENEKIAKQKEQAFKATIEKLSNEFKYLRFKDYDEGEE